MLWSWPGICNNSTQRFSPNEGGGGGSVSGIGIVKGPHLFKLIAGGGEREEVEIGQLLLTFADVYQTNISFRGL